MGNGSFTTEVTAEGQYFIYLAPYENSDPLNNGKSYQADFALAFLPEKEYVLLSRTLGILYFGLLLSGFVHFSRFVLKQQRIPGPLQSLPARLLMLDDYLAHVKAVIAGIGSALSSGWHPFFRIWGKLFVTTGIIAYWLVFMEWLFLITGASFMERMSLGEKLGIFLLSSLLLALVGLGLLLIFWALALALRLSRLSWLALLIAEWVPTVLLTTLIALLIDNFTYVIFHFGILTSSGILRTAYGVSIVLILCAVYWLRLQAWSKESSTESAPGNFRWLAVVTSGLVAISLLIAALRYDPRLPTADFPDQSEAAALDRPNIILLGSDGVTAKNMSIYGYERDTTPNLSLLGRTSLVAENAFSNSGNTLGSIASIFTSKLPTQTNVMYPPNILQGPDAFEHLPGILSRAGYQTIQIGVPHYVDAYTLNIQDGFDIVNQRSVRKDPLVSAWRNAGFDLSAYFIYKLEEKITNRFLHAFHLDTIDNPFSVVTQPTSWLDDRQKVDELFSLLDQNDAPLFIHVHLMGTHGPKFTFDEAKFSLGQEQSEEWMVDFYDDSILSFDQYVGEIVEYLKASRQYDDTILIIYSDHAMKFVVNHRIPMILHFPQDQYAGAISYNTQNIDLAPTILDYLELPIPDWMNGSSLLSVNPLPDRWIYSAGPINSKAIRSEQGWTLDLSQIAPPFYQFQSIQVVACDHWYSLDLWTQSWDSARVTGHTATCSESDLPAKDEIVQSIIDLLSSHGFDTSSLR